MISSNSFESELRLQNLSEESKNRMIQKFENFPTVPTQLSDGDYMKQSQILQQLFPWGCSKINEGFQFRQNDTIIDAKFPEISNICLSIKYGICPFFTPDSLKYVSTKLRESKEKNGQLYIKLIETPNPNKVSNDKVVSLARVNEVSPGQTFRFWQIRPGKYYPLGIAKIDIIAVGTKQHYSAPIHEIYNELKDSFLEWRFFWVADDLERIQRHKYIKAIKQNKCQKLEQQLKQKNMSMLDIFNNQ